MDRYTARMTIHGNTQRERFKNRLISEIQTKVINNPSFKDVKINGVQTHLIINSGTQPYYKEFESIPGQEINIGDYVEWANSHWLVTACDFDDELYRDGKLTQCNWLLKWQNRKGEIIERWAVINTASKYNDGSDGDDNIVIGSDQLEIIIPVDKESLQLKKSMSKKFFIDYYRDDPTAYELTGTGNVLSTYNGYGVTSWIVKECPYTPSEDDLKYGICDYFEPVAPPESIDESTDLWKMKILCSNYEIKSTGNEKTISALLYNSETGMEVPDITYIWNIESNVSDFITYSVNGKVLKISLSKEYQDFGDKILITCSSKYTGQSSTITLTTKGVY